MQGNCTTAPPPLSSFGLSGTALQRRPPQCLIVSDQVGLVLWRTTWLDAIYIRAKPSLHFIYSALELGEGARLYGSRLTLQGDPNWNTTAINAPKSRGTKAYIEGVCSSRRSFFLRGRLHALACSTVF